MIALALWLAVFSALASAYQLAPALVETVGAARAWAAARGAPTSPSMHASMPRAVEHPAGVAAARTHMRTKAEARTAQLAFAPANAPTEPARMGVLRRGWRGVVRGWVEDLQLRLEAVERSAWARLQQ